MSVQKRTKYLTVSAMLSALGVVCLMLGAFVEVLDLTTAVLASILCIYAVIEMGGAYPWGIWLVTSFLSLLLLPMKTPALFYACFAGFYPIIKEKIERYKRPVRILLKLLVFHICLAGIWGLLRLFLPAEPIPEGIPWFPILLYAAALICFLLYDLALTRLITFYLLRLRNRFHIK